VTAPLSLTAVMGDGFVGSVPLAPLLAVVTSACSALPPPGLPAADEAVRAALGEALNIDLQSVLTGGWAKVNAVAAAVASTREDQEAVAIVPLLDHVIAARHNPSIDLNHSGQQLCQLTFEIALVLRLKGVVLEVRRGRIQSAKSGHAVVEAVVSFLGQPLLKRASREFVLGGSGEFQPVAAEA
jgi:hypothetical protein